MTNRNYPSSFSLFLRLFKSDKKKRAYTLLEMSIVLLVLSVLTTGGITVATSMMDNAKKDLSKQRVAAIYEAMGRFVAKNKRLPCPASIITAKSDIGYGQESSGDCILRGDAGIYSSTDVQNIVYGMVPVNSLGLSDDFAEDGFGSKFSYVVNSHLTVRDDPSSYVSGDDPQIGEDDYRQGFGLYRELPNQTLNIAQLSSGNSINNVAFAIISHGANRNGAFSAQSAVQSNISSNQDDYYNISKQPSEGIGGAIGRASFGKMIDGSLHLVSSDIQSDNFDDILVFKSRSDLVTDFNLAHLIPCVPGEDMQSNGFSVVYSGQVATGNVCESYASISPQKVCGAHGNWIDKANCPASIASVESGSSSDLAITDSQPSSLSTTSSSSAGPIDVATQPFALDGAPPIPDNLVLPGGVINAASSSDSKPSSNNNAIASNVGKPVDVRPAPATFNIDDNIVASGDTFTIDGVLLPFDIP